MLYLCAVNNAVQSPLIFGGEILSNGFYID